MAKALTDVESDAAQMEFPVKEYGAEKLLAEVRRKPSHFCDDPRQRDLEDDVTQRAFANLDLEIERVRKLAGEVRSYMTHSKAKPAGGADSASGPLEACRGGEPDNFPDSKSQLNIQPAEVAT